MRSWAERSAEEARLLNPSFCALLLSMAVQGYAEKVESEMAYPLAFLILPVVLHKPTRDTLPRDVRTSLASWIDEHPAIALRFAERARSLIPFTKEAILFGANRSVLRVSHAGALMRGSVLPATKKYISETTEEVRGCVNKAHFVGRWFAKAGNAPTVMALWGVAP